MSCRVLACAIALTGSLGCGGGPDGTDSELHVYAASSLTDAFEQVATEFESANPGVEVSLYFSGSQVLALQIDQGAKADVFASADPAHLDSLVKSGKLADRGTFAWNALSLVVPLGNPAGIETLGDLPRARRIVLGTTTVPVGAYARELIRRASQHHGEAFGKQVLASMVSEENNARLIRAKVELGEADAAIVYRTDAMSSTLVRTIPIPPELNLRAAYVIGVVEATPRKRLADAWVDFVRSELGRRVLERHGFIVGPDVPESST